MTKRQAVRFNIYRPVSFCSGATEGEGTVVDLSPSGCRVKSDVPIGVGSMMCMFIVVPSDLMPITIGMATVRWANNGEFGVQFIRVNPRQQERLLALMAS
ncbi:MAG: PilZ domain-containing protein [Nitrospira sp.]